MPFFEFVPQQVAESPLRRELTRDELVLAPDGTLPLPRRPGLGVELDGAGVERCAVGGRRRAG
jgi:L-alanine-DL-glutamate epimerase-like enolase superfamily enzyme